MKILSKKREKVIKLFFDKNSTIVSEATHASLDGEGLKT